MRLWKLQADPSEARGGERVFLIIFESLTAGGGRAYKALDFASHRCRTLVLLATLLAQANVQQASNFVAVFLKMLYTIVYILVSIAFTPCKSLMNTALFLEDTIHHFYTSLQWLHNPRLMDFDNNDQGKGKLGKGENGASDTDCYISCVKPEL